MERLRCLNSVEPAWMINKVSLSHTVTSPSAAQVPCLQCPLTLTWCENDEGKQLLIFLLGKICKSPCWHVILKPCFEGSAGEMRGHVSFLLVSYLEVVAKTGTSAKPFPATEEGMRSHWPTAPSSSWLRLLTLSMLCDAQQLWGWAFSFQKQTGKWPHCFFPWLPSQNKNQPRLLPFPQCLNIARLNLHSPSGSQPRKAVSGCVFLVGNSKHLCFHRGAECLFWSVLGCCSMKFIQGLDNII